MIHVTVFNEFCHEQNEERIKEIYPKGIHTAIADFLSKEADMSVRTVTLYDENNQVHPDCGITDTLLKETDVLMWWGHMRHGEVSDEVVRKVCDNVLCGMGAIFLHSGHHSKPFKTLMGTSCNLSWRDGEKERLWNICPSHPIMQNVGSFIDLQDEEMYGECFDIPTPDELLMIGTYGSHEVFRSACTWRRGKGNIFYFQPGHEAYPTYYNPEIQNILKNAIRWAAPKYREDALVCPQVEPIAF